MNRCPNCGAQNRDGAKFCTSCGFRLPVDTPAFVTPDRSPFATTSSVPGNSVVPEAPEETIAVDDVPDPAATWQSASDVEAETGPGLSWESGPPRNTSIPVDDAMIASLLDEDESVESADREEEPDSPPDDFVRVPDVEEDLDSVLSDLSVSEPAVSEDDLDDAPVDLEDEATQSYEVSDVDERAFDTTIGGDEPIAAYGSASSASTAAPSVDSLLRLARELEYGLIELADSAGRSPAVDTNASVDVRLLANALNDLQSDEDLATLRESVSTAQDRPRDVDVMLDLVLRADAIAAVLTERDQLKHAIELALGSATDRGDDQFVSLTDDDQIDI